MGSTDDEKTIWDRILEAQANHYLSIRAVIARLLAGYPQDIDLTAAEVFQPRVFERYDPARGSLLTYLRAVARYRAISQHRRRKAEERAASRQGQVRVVRRGSRRPHPLELLLGVATPAEARRVFAEVLQELDEESRLIVVERTQKTTTYADLAAALDVEVNQVRVRFFRGLRKLEELLARRLPSFAAALVALEEPGRRPHAYRKRRGPPRKKGPTLCSVRGCNGGPGDPIHAGEALARGA